MHRKSLKWFILVLVVIGLAEGAFAYRQAHRYKHWAVHDPGLVYRSAWLEPDALAEMIEKHQIRSVINLCDPGEMGEQRWIEERQAVQGAGAQLLELTMPRTVNAADPVVERYIEVLRNPDNYPVLIHCQHGVTRTAELLSMYDILFRGLSADESLKKMPLFGRDDHNVAVKAFAASFEKSHKQDTARISHSLDVLRQLVLR